jgi:hypothetical protein
MNLCSHPGCNTIVGPNVEFCNAGHGPESIAYIDAKTMAFVDPEEQLRTLETEYADVQQKGAELAAAMLPKHHPFHLVNHETGHAIAGLWLGLPVREVRVDRPDDWAGLVTLDREPGRAFEKLLFCLGGRVAEGRPMRWLPRADLVGDEANAALLVDYLGFDAQDFADATLLVTDILRQSQCVRAATAIADRLLEHPVLAGDEAKRIFDAARSA